MRLRVGCSGWSYDHWKPDFYPAGLAKRDWLEHYASAFSFVEVNNTFYRYPRASVIESWTSKVPSDFRFVVKAHRVITHMKRFDDVEQQLRDFASRLEPFGRRLGGILYQLPDTIERDDELLEGILHQLDLRRHAIIEFRHASWWHTHVFERLERAGVVFCSVIAPDLPRRIVTLNGQAYVRVHGEDEYYRGLTSDRMLDRILRGLRAGGCERAFVAFNNDENAHAPRDAQRLIERI